MIGEWRFDFGAFSVRDVAKRVRTRVWVCAPVDRTTFTLTDRWHSYLYLLQEVSWQVSFGCGEFLGGLRRAKFINGNGGGLRSLVNSQQCSAMIWFLLKRFARFRRQRLLCRDQGLNGTVNWPCLSSVYRHLVFSKISLFFYVALQPWLPSGARLTFTN